MMIGIAVECVFCGQIHTVDVEGADYEKWQFEGMTAHRAFPYLSPKEREMLISHTCPDCWDRIFKEEGNEE